MKPLNILVIGTGMYTCGTGTNTYGTVMPAVFEWKRKNSAGEIYIAGTRPESIHLAQTKLNELQQLMQVEPSIKYFPEGDRSNPTC